MDVRNEGRSGAIMTVHNCSPHGLEFPSYIFTTAPSRWCLPIQVHLLPPPWLWKSCQAKRAELILTTHVLIYQATVETWEKHRSSCPHKQWTDCWYIVSNIRSFSPLAVYGGTIVRKNSAKSHQTIMHILYRIQLPFFESSLNSLIPFNIWWFLSHMFSSRW